MRRSLVIAVLVAAACQPPNSGAPSSASAGAPSASASVAPSTAGCGQTITKDFVLGQDLTCGGDALIVGADGITVDLGGHSITGPGKGQRNWPNPNLDSVGVKLQGRSRVTVRNGTISAFSTGILLDKSQQILVEAVTSTLSYYGIYFNESTTSVVKNMKIRRNTYGLHLQKSNDNQILDSEMVNQEYASPGGYGVYFFSSQRNRLVGNTINANLNWGIWFSDSKQNVIFHNNVSGNSPQVSDNVGGNTWYDTEKKEGNFWGDYTGKDADGDGIGDTPYEIPGPGQVVDAYPFVKTDGWTAKHSQTIDHYRPPAPRGRRDVQLVALAGNGVVTAAPSSDAATTQNVPASEIAIAPDDRTVYALSGEILRVMDAVTGEVRSPRYQIEVPGILAANRDGRHAIVVGPRGAVQVDTTRVDREGFNYSHEPRDIAPSWKHNQIFVSTDRGVDLFWLGKGGAVPYTIPLDGPGGALAMNRSGTRLYAVARGAGLVDVIDPEQYLVVDRIRVSSDPVAISVAPDESTLYVASTDGVTAVDLGTHAVRGVALFRGTPVDIGVSPNGDQVYVAVTGAERGIAVVSTTDLRESHFVRMDAAPERILVASY